MPLVSVLRGPATLLAGLVLFSACAGPSHRSQAVDWFKSGYYAGAMVGRARLGTSGGEIDAELAKHGFTSDTSTDSADLAWNVFGGYRFEDPFAIEVSALNLGQVDSTISGSPSSLEDFVREIAKLHPFLGKGVAVTGKWFVIDSAQGELALGAGAWIWAAHFDVTSATGEHAGLYSDGIDLTFGAAGTIPLNNRLDARLSWDRFYLEGEPADVFWVGLQGGLNVGRSKSVGLN